MPSIPQVGQWVNFLRHHDELNLARLTNTQRERVFAAFAPESEMRVYGRGIRRRLAPMLGGDQARIRLAYSVLFGLPGAPIVFYGEEIGMGENLDLKGRLSVRAPMQWTAQPNGGFSTAPPEEVVRAMVAGGDYGYERVNVATQRADPDSQLNWFADLCRARRECGEIGAGTWSVLDTGTDAVLGLRYDVEDSVVVVLNNHSPKRHDARLELSEEDAATVTELFRDRPYPPIEAGSQTARLGPFGYRWLRLGGIY